MEDDESERNLGRAVVARLLGLLVFVDLLGGRATGEGGAAPNRATY